MQYIQQSHVPPEVKCTPLVYATIVKYVRICIYTCATIRYELFMQKRAKTDVISLRGYKYFWGGHAPRPP